MKKINKLPALMLAALMILSLCACKSSEVRDVEDRINALDPSSIDLDQLIETQEAYSALSEKDRSKVGNYDALEDAFKAGYYELANRMLELGYTCDSVCSSNISMWENTGADHVQQSQLSAVLFGVEGNTWDDYVEICVPDINETEDELKNYLLYAAWGLYPDGCVFYKGYPLGVDDDSIDDILAACVAYMKDWNEVNDNYEEVFNDVTALRSAFTDNHPAELTTLNDWSITLNQYAEFSLNLSGSLASYTETASDYQSEISQYATEADSYY